MTIREAPETLETEDLIEMVNAGLVPLTVADKHIADFWKKVLPGITVHDAVAVRTGADIAWAMRKGSPQFKAARSRFHRSATVPGPTTASSHPGALPEEHEVREGCRLRVKERQKFLPLIEFFQKYGDKYDVDWLLMAAQGYQESRLDQKARSHVGAIGVMQIMPATGKDLSVGNIRNVEANIHGGIKYMRWMIDNYYGDEPMTKLDKALFAFASYNAGAGRSAATPGSREARPRSERLVPQRGICRRREDRRGDGDLRQQHLQVLHRLQTHHGSEGGERKGRTAAQGPGQISSGCPRRVTGCCRDTSPASHESFSPCCISTSRATAAPGISFPFIPTRNII